LPPETPSVHERPCGPVEPMLAGPPARDALFDEVVERTQRASTDIPNVVSGTADVWIHLGHQRRETPSSPLCLPPQLVADAL
jgi:hypothetical protein